MTLLIRYLGREVYASTLLVFSALILLFAFLDLIHELNVMGQGQYHIGYVLLFVALTIPGHVQELFPVAVLVGTIVALVQMAASSELTVCRASGASLWQLLGALFRIALPLVVLSFVVSEFIAPPCERQAQKLRLQAQNAQVALQEFRSGVWVKDERSFVNVRNVMPDSRLMDVNIYRFDEANRLAAITHAGRAFFVRAGQWRLEEVRETVFDAGRIEVHALPERDWLSALSPSVLSVLMVVPEQMSATDLYQYVQHLKGNGQQSARYEVAMWNKLVHPVALWVMMVLALPFALRHQRSGGVGGMVFAGIVLGLAFHFMGRLFGSLGALNGWPPLASVLTMPLLFLAVGGALLWWSERR